MLKIQSHKNIHGNTMRVHTFDSIGDVVDFVENTPKNPRTNNSSQSTARDDGWYGTATYQEACDLARAGWSDVRPEVEKIANLVRPRIRGVIRSQSRTIHDFVGHSPDVARYLSSGNPRSMKRNVRKPTATHGPVVTMVIDSCVSASITPEQTIARGAAVVALVEVLQTVFGHTVEIWFEDSGYSSGAASKGSTRMVKIQSAGVPIDSDHLMYLLAHPSVFRRHMFAVRERHTGFEESLAQGGYGSVYTKSQCADLVGADITINKPIHGDPMITDPAKWVEMALKSLGLWKGE